MKHPLGFVLLLALCGSSISSGSSSACASEPSPSARAAKTETVPEAEESISVDFTEQTIESIITRVGRLFQLDLRLPAAGLAGTSSVKLRDVTWRQIFAVTLKPAGYDFYELDGVVFILPQEEMDRLPIQLRSSELYFQEPKEVVRHLGEVFPKHASFSPTATGLTYRARPQHLPQIARELARIDSPELRLNPFPRPVFFPARLPELKPASARAFVIGADPLPPEGLVTTHVFVLRKVSAAAVAGYLPRHFRPDELCVVTDRRVNAVVLSAPNSLLPQLEALVTYLDDTRWYHPENAAAPATDDTSPGVRERP